MALLPPAPRSLHLMNEALTSIHQALQHLARDHPDDDGGVFKHLEHLNLHCNQLTETAALRRLPNLLTLNLSSNQLTSIAGLDALMHLQVLDLSANQLTDTSGIQHLPSLVRLLLPFNAIASLEGLEQLQRSPPHQPVLRYLDLRANRIATTAHLRSLAHLHSLQELRLRSASGTHANPLCTSAEYITEVQTILPSLQRLDEQSVSQTPRIDAALNRFKERRSLRPDPVAAAPSTSSVTSTIDQLLQEARLNNLELKLDVLLHSVRSELSLPEPDGDDLIESEQVEQRFNKAVDQQTQTIEPSSCSEGQGETSEGFDDTGEGEGVTNPPPPPHLPPMIDVMVQVDDEKLAEMESLLRKYKRDCVVLRGEVNAAKTFVGQLQSQVEHRAETAAKELATLRSQLESAERQRESSTAAHVNSLKQVSDLKQQIQQQQREQQAVAVRLETQELGLRDAQNQLQQQQATNQGQQERLTLYQTALEEHQRQIHQLTIQLAQAKERDAMSQHHKHAIELDAENLQQRLKATQDAHQEQAQQEAEHREKLHKQLRALKREFVEVSRDRAGLKQLLRAALDATKKSQAAQQKVMHQCRSKLQQVQLLERQLENATEQLHNADRRASDTQHQLTELESTNRELEQELAASHKIIEKQRDEVDTLKSRLTDVEREFAAVAASKQQQQVADLVQVKIDEDNSRHIQQLKQELADAQDQLHKSRRRAQDAEYRATEQMEDAAAREKALQRRVQELENGMDQVLAQNEELQASRMRAKDELAKRVEALAFAEKEVVQLKRMFDVELDQERHLHEKERNEQLQRQQRLQDELQSVRSRVGELEQALQNSEATCETLRTAQAGADAAARRHEKEMRLLLAQMAQQKERARRFAASLR